MRFTSDRNTKMNNKATAQELKGIKESIKAAEKDEESDEDEDLFTIKPVEVAGDAPASESESEAEDAPAIAESENTEEPPAKRAKKELRKKAKSPAAEELDPESFLRDYIDNNRWMD